jgi:hypothetical protein
MITEKSEDTKGVTRSWKVTLEGFAVYYGLIYKIDVFSLTT